VWMKASCIIIRRHGCIRKGERAVYSESSLPQACTYSVGVFHNVCFKGDLMTISPPEREAQNVKLVVDANPVETSFEKTTRLLVLAC
jgi:hypothetical protein